MAALVGSFRFCEVMMCLWFLDAMVGILGDSTDTAS